MAAVSLGHRTRAVLTLKGEFNKQTIRVWFPEKYVPTDGFIDGEAVKKDGFDALINFDGHVENCFIDSMKKSPDNGIILEIGRDARAVIAQRKKTR